MSFAQSFKPGLEDVYVDSRRALRGHAAMQCTLSFKIAQCNPGMEDSKSDSESRWIFELNMGKSF